MVAGRLGAGANLLPPSPKAMADKPQVQCQLWGERVNDAKRQRGRRAKRGLPLKGWERRRAQRNVRFTDNARTWNGEELGQDGPGLCGGHVSPVARDNVVTGCADAFPGTAWSGDGMGRRAECNGAAGPGWLRQGNIMQLCFSAGPVKQSVARFTARALERFYVA